ncbi:MAG: aldo/keto reductase [Pseudomonadota bacterium]|nr:aldo/keto reductase [Pseudomonadota bacterium]
MSNAKNSNMPYRQLGRSGLQISALSLGSWVNFGHQIDQKKSNELIAYAFDHGVNFFDNAEAYAQGEAERIMGETLTQYPRDEYIISTKLFWGGNKPNQTGLSRKHLHDGLNQSLKRLKLDYVDLLYCHRPDPSVPMVEIVTTMNRFIQQGKILYWGTSEWPVEALIEAYDCAKQLGLEGPTMEQPQYNLFHRERVEVEYQRLFEQYQMGTTIWSPLAGGLLTGKYNQGTPKNSRFDLTPHWQPDDIQQKIKKLQAFADLCNDYSIDMTQLAIAWCLQNPNVSSVILGASHLSQLEHNLGAINVSISNDLSDQIEKIRL